MPANHLILCCPLLLLPSIFPSVSVFSSELALCIRWPKDWSFSFSISPSNEYSGLISFRIDYFDHLTVQGTLKSLLQYQNLKASILWCSAFFMVQLSQPFVTTGKTIALTTWTSVSKVMSLLFNTLSRFVLAFLPRSKSILISWLLEKEMVIHSSILAWKSPWTEEPGGLQSMGLHDWACVHEGGGRRVGSNKLVELKKIIIISWLQACIYVCICIYNVCVCVCVYSAILLSH